MGLTEAADDARLLQRRFFPGAARRYIIRVWMAGGEIYGDTTYVGDWESVVASIMAEIRRRVRTLYS